MCVHACVWGGVCVTNLRYNWSVCFQGQVDIGPEVRSCRVSSSELITSSAVDRERKTTRERRKREKTRERRKKKKTGEEEDGKGMRGR